MLNRKTVYRECPICKSGAFVRKDGVGIFCRKCRAKENHKSRSFIDMKGFRSGKLVVTELFQKIGKAYFWECLCDCGRKKFVHGNRLRSQKTKSCGCITNTQNGLSASLLHRRWKAMISRCYNRKNINFSNYGGRGIKVCDEWLHSFECFVKDVGYIPDKMTLDRINVNGDYCKANCVWTSVKDQCNNKRNSFKITAFGKTQTLTQWANEFKIGWSTLRQRIKRNGWTPERALLTEIKKKK